MKETCYQGLDSWEEKTVKFGVMCSCTDFIFTGQTHISSHFFVQKKIVYLPYILQFYDIMLKNFIHFLPCLDTIYEEVLDMALECLSEPTSYIWHDIDKDIRVT